MDPCKRTTIDITDLWISRLSTVRSWKSEQTTGNRLVLWLFRKYLVSYKRSDHHIAIRVGEGGCELLYRMLWNRHMPRRPRQLAGTSRPLPWLLKDVQASRRRRSRRVRRSKRHAIIVKAAFRMCVHLLKRRVLSSFYSSFFCRSISMVFRQRKRVQVSWWANQHSGTLARYSPFNVPMMAHRLSDSTPHFHLGGGGS